METANRQSVHWSSSVPEEPRGHIGFIQCRFNVDAMSYVAATLM